ncbi:two-component system histidine kinase PnpS [Calidifontibacillus oryziterrae]|uniref:two-component system histidine kinase PnpS n=1 Tax=Calidifontibacillus oryziterrae TaxID=1191699 RepID=UPI0003032A16|nr:HAMP domain-containing sensor histidine kinase [Calidifontibacillus oryziterrae]
MNRIQVKIFFSLLLLVFIVFSCLAYFVGTVILSLSIDNDNHKIWALLIASFTVAGVLILMIGYKISSQYTRSIDEVIRVANELAKGNYHARSTENPISDTRMLNRSINILARNLENLMAVQQMQQDRLRTLIESMGSGLILIDDKGYINLANRIYKETFDVEEEDYVDHLYYDVFKHEEIIRLVEQIFMTEKDVRKEFLLPLKIERRYFEVFGTPIIGTNEEWKGVVLVFHDITTFKRLEQMRRDFVANVSHELKTPLTSLKGFSETLLDGAINDIESREYFLTIILKETERMQSLINDLLDLSKIEQDSFRLNQSSVNIKEILNEIVVMLENKAQAKNIQVIMEMNNNEHLITQGDSYRLKQIFINLIDNALNYTMDGGKVQISCKSAKDKIKVEIKDSGIGIKAEEIPRIFERFYRVDKARSRNSGGTGLGLAIVKHLVEAHHGKIDVMSELNSGTVFSITLNKEVLNGNEYN